MALLDTVPGFAVQVPGHPDEVPGLLRGAVGVLESGSTYLRLSTESNRSALPLWPGRLPTTRRCTGWTRRASGVR